MPQATGLGAYLRARREAKGLSVEELSGLIRVAARLIRALEAERFRELPAPVFVRGFIRAYCTQVGAAAESALALYEAKVVPSCPPRNVAVLQRVSPARRALGWRPIGLSVLAAALLAVVGGALYLLPPLAAVWPVPVPAPMPRLEPAPVPAVPPTNGAPESSPILESEPADEAAMPEPGPASSAPERVFRVLTVRAREPAWVRVVPDGGPPSQELLEPGSVRQWRGAEHFTVTVGNAGGVTVELDGVELPPLGRPGEVVRDLTIPGESGR